MLSDLPLGEDPGLVEQREESDEPASKISRADDRTNVLPQDKVVDQRNPQSDQVGEGVWGVLKGAMSHQKGYSTLN